ncbi:MAG: hypothetical protein LRY51_11990 [Geovibrio sp.]|nr:hypothetical protein [Geovibrio sp.]
MERTFAIVKPDATAAGNTGNILARIEKEGFKIVALKKNIHVKKKRLKASTQFTAQDPSSMISPAS